MTEFDHHIEMWVNIGGALILIRRVYDKIYTALWFVFEVMSFDRAESG